MAQCNRKSRNWSCPNEAAPGRKLCEEHLAQNRLHRKTWEERRERAGLCATPGCKAYRLLGGSKCLACREAHREKYGRGQAVTQTVIDERDRQNVHWALDALLARQRGSGSG